MSTTLLYDEPDEIVEVGRGKLAPRLWKNGAAYGLWAVVQRGSALLVLPFLLSAVTAAEYGQIALLTSIAGAASIILSFGLEAAVVRIYFQLQDDQLRQRRFVGTVATFSMVAPVVAVIAASVFLLGWSGPTRSTAYIAVALAGAAAQVPINTVLLSLMRLQDRLRHYSWISLVSAVSYVLLTLLFVVVLPFGVAGWLVGALGSALTGLAVGWWLLRSQLDFMISRRELLPALIFALPLLPHLLAHWGLNLSDRIVLGAYVSEADLGVYNLGYQLAMPIGLLAAALNRAVTPQMSRAAAPGGSTAGLSRVVTIQVWTTAFLGLAVILVAPALINMVLPPEYAPAASIVTWVAIGYVFYGWYFVPMNALSVLHAATRWIWIATALAACVNVALNLALVPTFGIGAAAVTTAVGYGTLMVAVSGMAIRSHAMTIHLEWARIALGTVALVVVGFATATLTDSATLFGAAVRVIVGTGLLIIGVGVEAKSSRTDARRAGA